jgi:hypothetical protein
MEHYDQTGSDIALRNVYWKVSAILPEKTLYSLKWHWTIQANIQKYCTEKDYKRAYTFLWNTFRILKIRHNVSEEFWCYITGFISIDTCP